MVNSPLLLFFELSESAQGYAGVEQAFAKCIERVGLAVKRWQNMADLLSFLSVRSREGRVG
jgi:hypothetical protein